MSKYTVSTVTRETQSRKYGPERVDFWSNQAANAQRVAGNRAPVRGFAPKPFQP